MKQRVRGLRQLQRYPRCDRLENLERELLNWKRLLQHFDSHMDPEHAFVMLSEFVPKALEEELIRQHITGFHKVLKFIQETLSRLNGDRLAEFEERRIQSTRQKQSTMPFINAVHDGPTDANNKDATPPITQELVQQLVAAMQQPRGPPRQPRVTPGVKAANWQGGACFECGATDHKREDCPDFIRLSALPGGYPKDHKNAYSKWKEANGLPAPGSRRPPPRSARPGGPKPGSTLTAAAVQQPDSTATHAEPTVTKMCSRSSRRGP